MKKKISKLSQYKNKKISVDITRTKTHYKKKINGKTERLQGLMVNIKKKKGNFTQEEVIKVAKDMRKIIENGLEQAKSSDNALFLVNTPYNGEIRSGKFVRITSDPKRNNDFIPLFVADEYEDAPEQDKFNFYQIMVIRDYGFNLKGGGCNNAYNDCLYNCLKEAFGGILPRKIETETKLKRLFGVGRMDKIPVDELCKLQEILKINIFVSGDYHRELVFNEYNKKLCLTLSNGHYTLQKNSKKYNYILKQNKGTQDLKIVFYHTLGDKIEYYDGYGLKTTEKGKLIGKHKIVKFTGAIQMKPEDDLIKEYNKFMKASEIINELAKELSNGKEVINTKKTPLNHDSALKLFYLKSKCLDVPEEMTPNEEHWFENATVGALTYAEKGEFNNATKYDFNSFYLWKMSKSFPVIMRQGRFTKITELPKRLHVGIYRCKITGESKLFRFNKLNYYTHIDIWASRELNLNVELICDENANALVYEKSDYLPARDVFMPFVKFITELRQKANNLEIDEITKKDVIKRIKLIGNSLWGVLCQKLRYDHHTKKGELDLENVRKILLYRGLNDGHAKIKYRRDRIYKYGGYGRIGAMIISHGRKTLSYMLKNYEKDIIQIHTDGFILKGKSEFMPKLGQEIGRLKQVYQGGVLINSCNDVQEK